MKTFPAIALIELSNIAAGIKTGDQIRRINGWPATLSSLSDITYKLRSRQGKKITLVIRRGEEILKFEFRLRDLI